LAKGGGAVPKHLLKDNTEIDLRPSSPEERRGYNRYLYHYIQGLIKEPKKYHWIVDARYEGFLKLPAKESFKRQMNRTFENREDLLKAELRRIEEKYHYNSLPDFIAHLYPYKIEQIGVWQAALFNAFVKGHAFDFSRREFSLYEMEAFVHVEQIFAYYKELHQLKTTRNKSFESKGKNTDLNQRFEKEFERAHLPFVEILQLNPSFKKELFHQFTVAEAKPCFDLYLADYYSEEQLREGFETLHNAIPLSKANGVVAASFVKQTPFENHIAELYSEFSLKVAKKELPETYFCPNIERTGIVSALFEIHGEYEILKKAVFESATDKYKEAEICAANIIRMTKRLGQFDHLVVTYLAENSDNIYLYLNDRRQELHEIWSAIKSNFNNELRKGQLNPMIQERRIGALVQNTNNPELRKEIENELEALRNAF